MKLKELLKQLQEIYDEYGDIQVFHEYGDINNVRVEEPYYDFEFHAYVLLEE